MKFILQDLLRPEVQEFIRSHEDDDEQKLVLKHVTLFGMPAAVIAEQIASRRKAKARLPSYYKTAGIVYPPPVNLEQSSSELAARLKQRLLIPFFGATAADAGADITGGFGVDSFFLSQSCKSFDYSEPSSLLTEISRHNHHALGISTINYHTETAEDFLSLSEKKFSFIYLDPSRRKDSKKVFRLSECEPDCTRLLEGLLTRSDLVLIKTSPLLDLQQGIRELGFVETIVVVSIRNECKEVLFFCRRNAGHEPAIRCIDLATDDNANEDFVFTFSAERNATSVFSDVQQYLYEPNASILKGGAFKIIGERLGLTKLHQHTHLYTSETLVPGFPGRTFHVDFVNPGKAQLKIYFPDGKANIMTRNYQLKPDALKKKLGLKDGGEKFLIGFSGIRSRFLVVATRVPNSR